MGRRPQTRHLPVLRDDGPWQQRGAATDDDVALLVAAGDHLLGEEVDRAAAHRQAVDLADALAEVDDPRQLRLPYAHGVEYRRVPLDVVERRRERPGDREVDGALLAQRVRRDRLRRPVRARTGSSPRGPPQELESLAAARGAATARAVTALVAVQQTRRERTAAGVDRRQRRHHRREPDGALAVSPHCGQGFAGAADPRGSDIVFQPCGRRNHERVRDARSSEDRPIGVGGDRLHRRRPDVDADGHLASR